MNKYRSPLDPPLEPASPLPDNLILVPSSTPFGILTVTFSLACILPLPLQLLQGVPYHFTITVTLRTGLLNSEETLICSYFTSPRAIITSYWFRTFCRPTTRTGFTRFISSIPYIFFSTFVSIFQAYTNVIS